MKEKLAKLAKLSSLAMLFVVLAGTDECPGDGGGGGAVPEIDPTMAIGGVAALAGGLMVLRHYRRRK